MGITIIEGYGLTETSPVIAVSTRDNKYCREIGYVGIPLPGVEVRITEENEIEIETLYIGGGTPSLINVKYIEKIRVVTY